ncbi:MAG: SLC13 family permease [Eubacteriales bacterium]|nr:SLC13 family permease [Eubacteriales bacterium]
MNKKYYLNSAIVVILMSFFRFIPGFGAMTSMGMTILGIFLGALWGWITCDMIWPSILALVMLGFSGYTANVSEALTATISNGTIQLILWLLVFSAILTTTGISKWFVAKLVNSRLCKGHPWRLSLFICLAVWVCAAFGAGFAAILICWQLVYTVCEQVGYTKADKWPKMMVCAIIFFNALGALALPFQAGVVANFGFLAKASEGTYSDYNYIQYLAFSIIFCVVTMVIYFLFCRFILRPDMSKLMNSIEVEKANKLDIRQKIAMGALIALIVLTIVPSCLPAGPVKAFLMQLGTTACVLLIVGFVTFLRGKDGKPYFTFKELANNGIMWPLLFMVATATMIGGALSSADTGFTATVTSVFEPVLANASPYICAAVIAIATLALTNLINNTVASAIMIPVMYPFAASLGINPLMMTAVVCFCANCGLLLPCASPAGAMLHGNKEWVSTKEAEIHSLLGIAALALAAVLVGIPLGGIIFR